MFEQKSTLCVDCAEALFDIGSMFAGFQACDRLDSESRVTVRDFVGGCTGCKLSGAALCNLCVLVSY